MELPNTLSLVLKLARQATILDWFAIHEELMVFIDDKPADRRTILRVDLKRGIIDLKTLRGFDAKKNAWTSGYIEPMHHVFLQNKRGQKELRSFVRALALAQNKFIPCPTHLTVYDVPKVLVENKL